MHFVEVMGINEKEIIINLDRVEIVSKTDINDKQIENGCCLYFTSQTTVYIKDEPNELFNKKGFSSRARACDHEKK